ncbi:MAG: nucleotidyltransferase family protein [Pseudomonadota bacterium]
MSWKVKRAMLLAAGRGMRMHPLTIDRPKALVRVAGRPLIDHALGKLAQAGVAQVVVNLHHHADLLETHLAARRPPPAIILSDERRALLETGGGTVKALPHLGDTPFFVVNVDVLWSDGAIDCFTRLASAWDGSGMDCLLLLVPRERARGHRGAGDFFLAGDGRLSRRGAAPAAPYIFSGLRLVHPRLFAGEKVAPFSFNRLFDKAQAAGRLFGLVHDGGWHDVGTPEMVGLAEAWLKEGQS